MRERLEEDMHDGWISFEIWADENGIGEHREDWQSWWACWRAGYDTAYEEAETEAREREEREGILENP